MTAPDPAVLRAANLFDSLIGLQELRQAARSRLAPPLGGRVADLGCGAGHEAARLAEAVGAEGRVLGIDPVGLLAPVARARTAGQPVAIIRAAADRLPLADGALAAIRCERLLSYSPDPDAVLAEMARVVRPGGALAVIEPDWETLTVDLPDRDLARRILHHDCDTQVPQGWMGRQLLGRLAALGGTGLAVDSRAVIYPPAMALPYLGQAGRAALSAGIIDAAAQSRWQAALDDRARAGRLFCTVTYFMYALRPGPQE